MGAEVFESVANNSFFYRFNYNISFDFKCKFFESNL